jgi:hypothetical protein
MRFVIGKYCVKKNAEPANPLKIFNIAAGASVTVLAENGLGERTVDAQALEVFQKVS